MNASIRSSEADSARVYLNPPVVEALCEVYFTSTNWDDSIPDKFFEEIKEKFPKQQEHIIRHAEITVNVPIEEISGDMQPGPSRKLFFTEKEDQLIQISENLLVFNQLTPYLSFPTWENILYEALSIYEKLVSPQAIDRIGVRYLNHITIPKKRFPMSDYFTIFPHIPLGSGDVHGPFLINCLVPQSDDSHLLTISFNSVEPEPPNVGGQVFLLDLYDQASIGKTLNEAELKTHVRIAHGNVVRAFEGSITDNLRNLFNKEK
jgi:uncharacterized protein (TIGR04255 family)